jgi:hypothetical protein
MRLLCLHCRFRNLGCRCTSAKIPALDNAAAYAVSLLQQKTDPPKTLKDCLPVARAAGAQRMRG